VLPDRQGQVRLVLSERQGEASRDRTSGLQCSMEMSIGGGRNVASELTTQQLGGCLSY